MWDLYRKFLCLLFKQAMFFTYITSYILESWFELCNLLQNNKMGFFFLQYVKIKIMSRNILYWNTWYIRNTKLGSCSYDILKLYFSRAHKTVYNFQTLVCANCFVVGFFFFLRYMSLPSWLLQRKLIRQKLEKKIPYAAKSWMALFIKLWQRWWVAVKLIKRFMTSSWKSARQVKKLQLFLRCSVYNLRLVKGLSKEILGCCSVCISSAVLLLMWHGRARWALVYLTC